MVAVQVVGPLGGVGVGVGDPLVGAFAFPRGQRDLESLCGRGQQSPFLCLLCTCGPTSGISPNRTDRCRGGSPHRSNPHPDPQATGHRPRTRKLLPETRSQDQVTIR